MRLTDEAQQAVIDAAREHMNARAEGREGDALVAKGKVRALCDLFESLGRAASDNLLDRYFVSESSLDKLENMTCAEFSAIVSDR